MSYLSQEHKQKESIDPGKPPEQQVVDKRDGGTVLNVASITNISGFEKRSSLSS